MVPALISSDVGLSITIDKLSCPTAEDSPDKRTRIKAARKVFPLKILELFNDIIFIYPSLEFAAITI
jgi:hypothetical protein